jgi:2-hydroxycyclohexanecarboxyl-CoA dehydrogenase
MFLGSTGMSSVQSSDPQTIADCGVLIVGGTSGVGRAAAQAFISAGAPRLVLVGRNHDRGEAVRDELGGLAQAEVEFVAADIRDAEGAVRAANEAQNHLQRIDVLINAAAGAHLPALFHYNSVEAIPGLIADLVLPPLLMARTVLPLMRAQCSGCIINVASDAAKVPTPGESVIGAAMAAIVTFSRTLAMESKRDGVRVNVLTPSLIEGTGTAERLIADQFSARLFGKARERADLGVSTPDDQAALMVYLAGPHGRRITGQAISVNGGISAG